MRCIWSHHYINFKIDSENCSSRCEMERARFMAVILLSLFPSDQLVFVDETEFVCDTQYINALMQISL